MYVDHTISTPPGTSPLTMKQDQTYHFPRTKSMDGI